MVGGPEQKTRRDPANGYASPPFRAIGWMRGFEILKGNQYKAPYGKDNFAVPAGDLHEMSTLPKMVHV
jgi:hypothetical protein